MWYLTTAETDVGIRRKINQDSLLIRHALRSKEEVLLCVLCDGMGGLARGEYASTEAVRLFSDWFDRAQRRFPDAFALREVAEQWEALIRELNEALLAYGEREKIRLGTTVSAILFADDRYLLCHVGDSRIYRVGWRVRQLTEDQTFVAREVKEGRLSAREARTDHRKNVLLQCVGASPYVVPQISEGRIRPGFYLLCSDGFYHEIGARNLQQSLFLRARSSKKGMHACVRRLINQVKKKGETDNISALLVRVRRGSAKSTEKRRG